MLRQMKAQMAEMQVQMEAMQQRINAQEAKQKKQGSGPGLGKAVQVYGQARVSLDFTDNDTGSDGTEIVSNASRIGVKGEMPTSIADTALIYQAELRYETTDEPSGDDSGEDEGDSKEVEFREGFAGLKGNWGKLRLGRLSTGYKSAGTKIDPWTDNVPQARGRGRQGMSELHSSYFNNAVEYVTPQVRRRLYSQRLVLYPFREFLKEHTQCRSLDQLQRRTGRGDWSEIQCRTAARGHRLDRYRCG